jgi:hypothetical protein
MRRIKTIVLIVASFVINQNAFGQQPEPNPKNMEIARRFSYFLENGFESIDLMKVGSIHRSFFSLGTPQLVIYDKNDRIKKNLLNSYSIMVQPSQENIQGKVFSMQSPQFTNGCKQFLTILPIDSKITFAEVKLNTTIPVVSQPAPGAKHVLGPGVLPIAFFLYLK